MTINEIRRAELLQNERFRSQELQDAQKRTQISADTLEETKRKNLETESIARGELALRGATLEETHRSNLAREGETNRSNVVNEQERERHNRASERIGWAGIGSNLGSSILRKFLQMPNSGWKPTVNPDYQQPGLGTPNSDSSSPWGDPGFGGAPLPNWTPPGDGTPTSPSTPTLPESSGGKLPELDVGRSLSAMAKSAAGSNVGTALLNIAFMRSMYQSLRALSDPEYAAAHQDEINRNPLSWYFTAQQGIANQVPVQGPLGTNDWQAGSYDSLPRDWDVNNDSL